MAWHEQGPSGNFFVCLRIGDKRFRRSLKTDNKGQADEDLARIEENLLLVERGWLTIPRDADVVSFLLSDGRVAAPIKIEQVALKVLFSKYFKSLPAGSLEESTLYTMKVHRRRLEKYFRSRLVESIDIPALQEYINKRQREKGRHGRLSPTTIRKEIATLRTVWNWGKRSKLVKEPFPDIKGLKYAKGKEKPPYMPFKDVLRRTRGASEAEAAELWECVFLTRQDLEELLEYVKSTAMHPFIYPMFIFCAHTGARRSEMARARLADLADGFITLRERKRSRETKTTRRVPLSGLLQQVIGEWMIAHPGGPLFHDGGQPFTRKALAHHFNYTLRGSKWKDLQGWHVFRHSFISCLAAEGIDQRIIDDLVGHTTEQQRRPYRHLLPNKIRESIVAVFG
jgi:integrase